MTFLHNAGSSPFEILFTVLAGIAIAVLASNLIAAGFTYAIERRELTLRRRLKPSKAPMSSKLSASDEVAA